MMAVGVMPNTLLFVAPAGEGAWLGQHFPNYQILTISDPHRVVTHCRADAPAAVIAPFSDAAIKLFAQIGSQRIPDRPLLVLLVDSPADAAKHAKAADLAISAEWLPVTLLTALEKHAEYGTLRRNASAAAEHKRSTEEIHLLRNAIVRTVSHELRTPMLQVKAAVAMLVDEQVDEHAGTGRLRDARYHAP